MTAKLFNAFNYLVPASGSVKALSVQQDFSAPFVQNFQQLETDADEFHPSGVFIDNTNGLGTITVTVVETGYQITCAAGAQKQVPYPAPVNHSATISSTGAGVAVVTFVDFPVLPFESRSANSPGGSVSVSSLPALPAGANNIGTVNNTPTVPAGQSSNNTVGAASAVIVPANTYSRSFTVQNTSAANNLFIAFGAAATVADLKLAPGQAMTFQHGSSVQLAAIGSAAGTTYAIIGA